MKPQPNTCCVNTSTEIEITHFPLFQFRWKGKIDKKNTQTPIFAWEIPHIPLKQKKNGTPKASIHKLHIICNLYAWNADLNDELNIESLCFGCHFPFRYSPKIFSLDMACGHRVAPSGVGSRKNPCSRRHENEVNAPQKVTPCRVSGIRFANMSSYNISRCILSNYLRRQTEFWKFSHSRQCWWKCAW